MSLPTMRKCRKEDQKRRRGGGRSNVVRRSSRMGGRIEERTKEGGKACKKEDKNAFGKGCQEGREIYHIRRREI